MSLNSLDPEARGLLAEIRANHARLRECRRHAFERVEIHGFGQKHTCTACGGVMKLTEIGEYIRGYEAAGGNAGDIYPGWPV